MPPIESVGEFKVQTNKYDASYGRTGGRVVAITTKSGTNSFHGSLFEFLLRLGSIGKFLGGELAGTTEDARRK